MLQLNNPIFLTVEYSRSFINEYPYCTRNKNILMPYPTTDPDFFSKKLFIENENTKKLIFYHGGMHGSCEFVRAALNEVTRDGNYAIQRGDRKREQGFQSAVFCPIPVGDSPSSKRMYDVLNVNYNFLLVFFISWFK
jgi:hypothetical protein